MKINVHPQTPQERFVKQAADILRGEGVIIYPTDTAYAFGCSVHSKKAMERIYRLKQTDKNKPLTFIAADFAQLQEYIAPLPTAKFRMLKRLADKPVTFIFPASKKIPQVMLSKRSTVGIRIPISAFPLALCRETGFPVVSTSVPPQNEEDYYPEPDTIYGRYKKQIDLLIDSGIISSGNSTVIDYTGDLPVLVRQGDIEVDEPGILIDIQEEYA
ncbi:hypothetical protein CHS0354_002023 [Potamilus streckersoni]|uniref:Threonylcarbamoyl-AMP synthase n=1 Tax=Potamilus streckersoni TaxID=2493646 RepID=A0AAE0W8K5_9BIVA|nr:hypothetical protein CHS0354_002023 [Potamilus streckersoni]